MKACIFAYFVHTFFAVSGTRHLATCPFVLRWSLSCILWEKQDIRGFILNAVPLTLKIQGPFIPSTPRTVYTTESNPATVWSPLCGDQLDTSHVRSCSVRKTVPDLKGLESWGGADSRAPQRQHSWLSAHTHRLPLPCDQSPTAKCRRPSPRGPYFSTPQLGGT